MGGAKSGNVASSLAVEVFVEEIRRCWVPNMDSDRVDQMLRSAVKLANFTVFDQAVQFEEFSGMGTTLVAALIRENEATLVNVGDSRAILFRGDDVHQLTKDHSYVQAMVDSGKITEEEALTHPQKNIITRAIGVQAEVETDTFVHEFSDGDLLLLCSDGLTNELSYERLQQLIQTTPRSGLAEELIAQANAAGGHDNSTVVLVEA
jgi:protein phosphatase